MSRYILVRYKSGKLKGAIPVRKGASRDKLKSMISSRLKAGLKASIVTFSQLKNILKRNVVLKR